MKPSPFRYAAPASLEEALRLKAAYADEAKFLAGGQSLIPAMNFRVVQTGWLVDINRLDDLAYIRRAADGELRLGGLTRQRQLERDPLVSQAAPLLAEAMPYVAHPQIRNRGTLGGSLAHADPAAELPVIAVTLGARFRLQSAGGERWVAAEDFFHGLFATALRPDEMLVEVGLPPLPPRTGTSFMEVARRRGDYAMAGVAAVVTLEADGRCRQARLVYLNAGEGPLVARQAAQALAGQPYSDEAARAAAAIAAQEEIQPIGNVHASPEYQRHLAGVLTRRALKLAYERAAAV